MFYSEATVHQSIRLVLVTVLLILIGSGCDLLNVNNPNSLVENNLENPASASSLANGAEATVTEALGVALGPYSTATDELTWVGTLDAWQQLDQGEVSDPQNQFVDEAFNQLSEARWTADQAVRRLEKFKQEGTLKNQKALIRAYFYAAVAYTSIGEMFDNFVISEKGEAAPPVGESSMKQLFKQALEYIQRARQLTTKAGASKWETRLLALKARVHFSRGLWKKLNPTVNTKKPLVSSQEAVDAARKALNRIGSKTEWKHQLEVTSRTQDNEMAYSVNQRLELRFGDQYIEPTSDNKVDSVVLEDPIDDITSPHLKEEITEFSSAEQYADITVLSTRELHLIIAEHALAKGKEPLFRKEINIVRSFNQLTEYNGQLPAVEILKYERRVNLFLQGRRLADLYRFQETAPQWVSSRTEIGDFFPITITEIRSNPNVDL